MKRKLLYWFLESFGRRDEIKRYLGHGDYDIEQGWHFRGKWYPMPNSYYGSFGA